MPAAARPRIAGVVAGGRAHAAVLAQLRSAALRARPSNCWCSTPSACRPGEYGGDAVERLFTNRLDWDAHPYFEQIRGIEVSAHFFVRRDGSADAVRFMRRAGLACGRVVLARPRAAATTSRSASNSKGWKARPSRPAQYAALAPLARALARRYPIEAVVGHEHVAPGRKRDPGEGFDWQRLRASLNGLAWDFPEVVTQRN